MSVDVIFYITKCGYLAIFLLVFLQEIGAPNPIPNEFILLSAGYTVFIGALKFPIVLITIICADFFATLTLHTLFYFFGTIVLQSKPKWLPIPFRTIQYVKQRIETGGTSAIYIGRLLPFIRGYTSVIAGLLQIKTTIYIPVALITASIWSLFYLTVGILLGPVWERVLAYSSDFKRIIVVLAIVILLIYIMRISGKILIRKTNVKNGNAPYLKILQHNKISEQN
jgi:membrane protein DedA with SNARE-associated domain